jgi:hypothetical protein
VNSSVFIASVCLTGSVILVTASAQSAPTTGAPKPVASATHGLNVRGDGVLLKDGKPYRGIGVNYFDAFARHLAKPQDTSYDAGFAALAKARIPFARIEGCGFWPRDQKLYQEDPQEFLRRFDDVVRSAEKHGIGLIPSLFWTTFTVPDLVGESLDQWGNAESKSRAYMRNYVRDVVGRYRNFPAVWGWEFGNEYNLAADLPNAAQHRPPVIPHVGTAHSRSQRDELSYATIRAAFVAFAREVRKYDASRIIATGNSHPRESAWHNWKEKSWQHDTLEQRAEMLRDDNPDPVDLISVHVYDRPGGFITEAMRVARSLRKPLFIGEFGAGSASGTADERERFETLLAAIEQAKVPLAALWVYDFKSQDKTFNITWGNARSYQLRAIAEANERIRKELCEP